MSAYDELVRKLEARAEGLESSAAKTEDWHEFMPGDVREHMRQEAADLRRAAAAIRALEGDNRLLETENAQERQLSYDRLERLTASEADRQSAEAKLEAVREALLPFGLMCRVLETRATVTFGNSVPDSERVCVSAGEAGVAVLTMGDFRQALAALDTEKAGGSNA